MGRFMPNVFGDGRGRPLAAARMCIGNFSCASDRTLGQDLERGMRDLSRWALA